MNYTVYAPDYEPGKGCWDCRTVTRARLAVKKLGAGARLRRNVNITTKNRDIDWYVQRVWEWNGEQFVDITEDPSKGLP